MSLCVVMVETQLSCGMRKCSGAAQRMDPPMDDVMKEEVNASATMWDKPKSVSNAFPLPSIRTFDCKNNWEALERRWIRQTHSSQISMHYVGWMDYGAVKQSGNNLKDCTHDTIIQQLLRGALIYARRRKLSYFSRENLLPLTILNRSHAIRAALHRSR